jgi:hypothetical protein
MLGASPTPPHVAPEPGRHAFWPVCAYAYSVCLRSVHRAPLFGALWFGNRLADARKSLAWNRKSCIGVAATKIQYAFTAAQGLNKDQRMRYKRDEDLQLIARTEGRGARRRGASLNSNPYAPYNPNKNIFRLDLHWEAGWLERDDDAGGRR